MPIEIKEINIRAEIYPAKKTLEPGELKISRREMENLKNQLKKEILRELKFLQTPKTFER